MDIASQSSPNTNKSSKCLSIYPKKIEFTYSGEDELQLSFTIENKTNQKRFYKVTLSLILDKNQCSYVLSDQTWNG